MPQTTTEPASQRSAYKMAAMLIAIGVGHFAAPKPFDTIVPAELPGSPRFYTLASGVAEVGVGALLLAPRTRRLGAAAAVVSASDAGVAGLPCTSHRRYSPVPPTTMGRAPRASTSSMAARAAV